MGTHGCLDAAVEVDGLGVFLTAGKSRSVTQGQFLITHRRCVKSILRRKEKKSSEYPVTHTNIGSSGANGVQMKKNLHFSMMHIGEQITDLFQTLTEFFTCPLQP